MRSLDFKVDLVIQMIIDDDHRLYSRQSSGKLAASQPVGVVELHIHQMYPKNLATMDLVLYELTLAAMELVPNGQYWKLCLTDNIDIFGHSAYQINPSSNRLLAYSIRKSLGINTEEQMIHRVDP